MKNNSKTQIFTKSQYILLFCNVLAILICIIVNIIYKNIPIFVESFHSRFIYKIVSVPLSYISALIPFSIFEVAIPILIIVLLFLLFKKRRVFIITLATTIAVFTVFYSFSLGFNYNRAPLYINMNFSNLTLQKQDVAKSLSYVIRKLNSLKDTPEMSIKDMKKSTNAAFVKLAEQYSFLKGGVVYPKSLISSSLFSFTGITGFFSPITMEGNINTMFPSFSLPVTMTHEGAHIKGFAREDECEFIGFLACIGSDNLYFNYSGYMQAFSQLCNALYSADKELYKEIIKEADAKIITEWNSYFEYSKLHQGYVEDLFTKLNDSYIKSQGDENGIKSYSNGVSYIVSYISELEDFN